MKIVTDAKLATIAVMSIALLLLGIANYILEDKIRAKDTVIAEQKAEIVEINIKNSILENANKDAITLAQDKVKIVEKKVVEIKKVYVPQIEYIDRYIGDNNDTCVDSQELVTSFVY